jgi:hypothetical protein
MSAWVVEREHIDVLIAFGLSKPSEKPYWRRESYAEPFGSVVGYAELRHDTADEVGGMLWQENVASVCARYEDDTADDYAEVFDYAYRDPGCVMTPGEALKAIGCLEYQSCEHDGWADSEAKRCLDALEARAVGMLYEGPWGWDKDALAGKPKRVRII